MTWPSLNLPLILLIVCASLFAVQPDVLSQPTVTEETTTPSTQHQKLSDMYSTSIFAYAMNYPAMPVIAFFRTNQQSEMFDRKPGLDDSLSGPGIEEDFATDTHGVGFSPVHIQQWPDVYSRQNRPFFNFLQGLLMGPPGPPGEKGDMGPQGATGSKGETGPAGAKGDAGPQGATGSKGERGPDGAKGDMGPQGATGSKGERGPDGAKGDMGPQGATGSKGERGPDGAKGDMGPQGATGSKGERGPPGEKGDMGPQGPTGSKGDRGPAGAKGDAGTSRP